MSIVFLGGDNLSKLKYKMRNPTKTYVRNEKFNETTNFGEIDFTFSLKFKNKNYRYLRFSSNTYLNNH